MKFTAASILLAASSAFASPVVERGSSIQVSDFWARAGLGSSASMHFVVTDANYPDDTPTDCNLLWSYGSSPKLNARCNNGQYYIRFPDGPVNFDQFTLELERVSGPIPEHGSALLKSGTEWACEDNPQEGVVRYCAHYGVLNIAV